MTAAFNEKIDGYCKIISEWLANYFNKTYPAGKLNHSMSYSLQAGGKRIRPILTMQFYSMCGGKEEDALPLACAIEVIHTYSIIHDDMPCMDNDDLRRGKPTNHRVYGEACALLAGDALQNAAFEIMSERELFPNIPSDRLLDVLFYVGRATGAQGMAGGQMLDLYNEDSPLPTDELVEMYILKTAALIRAAAVSGCILAGADEAHIKAAENYANSMGLAFQLNDDILDKIGNPKITGKAAGSDRKSGKDTLIERYGFDETARRVRELTEKAMGSLNVFPDNQFLTELTQWLCMRDK